MKDAGKFEKVELFNHLGQLVFSARLDRSRQNLQINRAKNWVNGMYYLIISGDKNRVVKKVSFN
jgi:hypothetical protein